MEDTEAGACLDDRVVVAELHACPDDAPELLGHFSVAALHGVEVEVAVAVAAAGASRDGARGAAADADAVRRAADLDDEHADLWRRLVVVRAVDLAEAPREHDRLDPLAPLLVRQPLPKRAGEARDERLAKLVAVVRGAVGGFQKDPKRGRERRRVRLACLLPWQLVRRDLYTCNACRPRSDACHTCESTPTGAWQPRALSQQYLSISINAPVIPGNRTRRTLHIPSLHIPLLAWCMPVWPSGTPGGCRRSSRHWPRP